MASDDPPRPPVASARDRWLAATVVLVLAFYAWRIAPAESELGNIDARGAYYNRLIDGFRAGHLHLAVDVPAGLRQLADPYAPAQSQPYRGHVFAPGRLHDTTYFREKIYLYFGVTPAVVLFWPCRLLTGTYLSHAAAVGVFCSLGFMVATLLLRRVVDRCFPATPPWIAAGCTLALGGVTSVPATILRPDVWEVTITCGYAFVMASLYAVWRACDAPGRRTAWLIAAGAAYGLAVGARPSLLVGAPMLLVPFLPWFRSGPRDAGAAFLDWREAAALVLPLGMIGAALAAYNFQRFGSITEFGQTYQLADDRQDIAHFGLQHFWFNVRAYFLQPAAWEPHFPFVAQPTLPDPPAGHGAVDRPNGLLVNTPFTAGAFALPWLAAGLAGPARAALRGLLVALAVVFGSAAFTLCLFYGTCVRYQVDFQPALALLASLAACASYERWAAAGMPRRVWTVAFAGLLACSLGFSVLKDWHHPALLHLLRADTLAAQGRPDAAIPWYERALARHPRSVQAHENLGLALLQTNRPAEAAARFEAGLRVAPAHAGLHVDLGGVRWTLGQRDQAIRLLETAVKLAPGSIEAHFALANALHASGRPDEARAHFDQVRRLRPDLPLPR